MLIRKYANKFELFAYSQHTHKFAYLYFLLFIDKEPLCATPLFIGVICTPYTSDIIHPLFFFDNSHRNFSRYALA